FESMPLAAAVERFLEWAGADVDDGERLLELVDEVLVYAGGDGRKPEVADLFGLVVRLWAGERVYADGSDADVDLSGWLELLWEDAPELVVAGFNEGRVPDPVVGDAFLPEAGRELLGLRRNAERVARDAYLFDAVLRWREVAGGEVHVVCGKVGQGGEPLKPSRLLLMCEDVVLPERTRRLFGEAERGVGNPVPGWERTWLLEPPVLKPHGEVFGALRVTDFSGYLACPFRFYLKRGLRMEALDVEKEEMEARDFGTGVHAALEQLWNVGWARESSDVKALKGLMDEAVEEAVEQRYGKRPPVPVVMQLEVAKERLRKAVEVHAGLVDEGWRTVEVERKFWEEEADAWSVGGVNVRGTIDRIDVHEDGRVRVLDYKTSQKASAPMGAHLEEVTKRTKLKWDDLEDWQRVEGAGKRWRWTNLQLPLYCLWARDRYAGAERLECGYFNLPVALGETGVSVWEDGVSEWVLEAALRCAEGVAERVRGGVFWPPEERVKYDDFDGLAIGGGLLESVDGEAWKRAFEE
ncbi:MAG: PD-(D/E)XK nuclease family protein, partial [Verrucomicrobiales bacterium]|nr:PD-(D/E)XK nuclease family protein [Verrucomicrobiales bacterium]